MSNCDKTPVDLRVGGSDSDLDARLSQELGAYNLAASGIDDQQEFTVKVEDGIGLVAGLSGWTWEPLLVSGWCGYARTGAGVVWEVACSTLRSRSPVTAAASA